jgi:hypothetical protein
MIEAASERTVLGPNALRHVEQSLAAVAGLDLTPRQEAVLTAINAYSSDT